MVVVWLTRVGRQKLTALVHLITYRGHVVLVNFALLFVGAIKSEVILSFLGLGVVGEPSWGIMIAEGFAAMRSHPHLAIYPGIALALVMLAFNFLGDGLRDALDPHTR